MDNNQLVFELMNAFRRVNKLRKKQGERFGIKKSEFIFLSTLVENIKDREGIKVSDISSILEITPAAATHMINSLEELDLLERTEHPTDRRIVLIHPTKKGYELIEKMHEYFFEDTKNLIEFIGKENAIKLIELLNQVSDYYKQKHGCVKGDE